MSYTLDLRTLRETPDQLHAIAEETRAKAEKIRRDKDLTSEGRRTRLEELRAQSLQKVAGLVQEANETRQTAERLIATTLKRKPDTTEKALLAEQQEARAWRRAERLLDAGTDVATLITRAGQAGDVATLNALRVELPAWLEARAVGGASALGKRTAALDVQRHVEGILEAIDEAEAPHAPFARRDALTAKREIRSLSSAIGSMHLLADGAARGQYNPKHLIEAALHKQDAQRGLGQSEQAAS